MMHAYCLLRAAVPVALLMSAVVAVQVAPALVREGTSPYIIAVPLQTPPSVRLAAEELRRYVERATAATLPIVETWAVAGAGPKIRPRSARNRFNSAQTTPGCTRAVS